VVQEEVQSERVEQEKQTLAAEEAGAAGPQRLRLGQAAAQARTLIS
jgi:hypothetical protein